MGVGNSSENSLNVPQLTRGLMPQDSNFLQLSSEYVNFKCCMIHNLLRNYQDLRKKLTSDSAVSKPLSSRLGIYREFPSENFLVGSMNHYSLSIRVNLSSTNLRILRLPYKLNHNSYIASIDQKIQADALAIFIPEFSIEFFSVKSQRRRRLSFLR